MLTVDVRASERGTFWLLVQITLSCPKSRYLLCICSTSTLQPPVPYPISVYCISHQGYEVDIAELAISLSLN